MKQIMLLCAAFCAICFVSCKKDEERITLRTEKITAHPWLMKAMSTKVQVGVSAAIESDNYDQLPACMRDNEYTFNMDQTISVDEGGEKCDPEGAQSYTLPNTKWSFKTADTQLELTDDNGSVLWDIVMFNDTALLLRNVTIEYDTIVTTITTKYIPVR